jgi:hypothetical protein
MPSNKKDRKAKITSNKVLLASVIEEMAHPRVAESARLTADEQGKKRHGKPASHHAGRTAKPHIEEYGTDTPVEETS